LFPASFSAQNICKQEKERNKERPKVETKGADKKKNQSRIKKLIQLQLRKRTD
jgi:hypothetical protein